MLCFRIALAANLIGLDLPLRPTSFIYLHENGDFYADSLRDIHQASVQIQIIIVLINCFIPAGILRHVALPLVSSHLVAESRSQV